MTDPAEPRRSNDAVTRPEVMPLGSADALRAFTALDEGLIGTVAAIFSSASTVLAEPPEPDRHGAGGGDGGDGGERPDPLEAMRRALKQQLTDELVEKATNVADTEVGRMRRHRVADCDDGEDLVQTVLTRTWEGRLHWRHDTVSLLQHVCDLLRQTSRRLCARGRTGVSLTELLDDPKQQGAVEEALGRESPHPGVDPVRGLELRRIAAEVEETLWNMATVLADPDVLIGLGAVLQGARGEHEIAEATDLDVVQARRAWRRLRQWFDDLPAGLRDRARELL